MQTPQKRTETGMNEMMTEEIKRMILAILTELKRIADALERIAPFFEEREIHKK